MRSQVIGFRDNIDLHKFLLVLDTRETIVPFFIGMSGCSFRGLGSGCRRYCLCLFLFLFFFIIAVSAFLLPIFAVVFVVVFVVIFVYIPATFSFFFLFLLCFATMRQQNRR
jgi:hypothetical protein